MYDIRSLYNKAQQHLPSSTVTHKADRTGLTITIETEEKRNSKTIPWTQLDQAFHAETIADRLINELAEQG